MRLSSKGQHTSGAYLRGLAHLKEESIYAYRDQERLVERKRGALKDTESATHRMWRTVFRKGQFPELTTPATAVPLLDLWRQQVEAWGHATPVSDPTRRPLEWALDKYVTDENMDLGWPPA